MKKLVWVLILILILMFAEYRIIMRNIEPHLIDSETLLLEVFGITDEYDL